MGLYPGGLKNGINFELEPEWAYIRVGLYSQFYGLPADFYRTGRSFDFLLRPLYNGCLYMILLQSISLDMEMIAIFLQILASPTLNYAILQFNRRFMKVFLKIVEL